MTLQNQIEKYRIVDPAFANILEKDARKADFDQRMGLFGKLQSAAKFAYENPDAFLSGQVVPLGRSSIGSLTTDEFFREFNSAQQMFNTIRPGENFMDYLLGRQSNSMANAPKAPAPVNPNRDEFGQYKSPMSMFSSYEKPFRNIF